MNSILVENNFQSSTIKASPEATYPMHRIKLSATAFPLNNKYSRFIKRTVDVCISLVLIPLVLSWLIPLLALLIKLDSRGPVFFLQTRNGHGGKLFTCIKFRTMFVNEEADLLAARQDDPRITRFGNFLRHYHLDELPQLFNVLMGDMSVIGPRPYMVNENLYYEGLLETYSYRHIVKPGITGLAQSYGYFGSIQDLDHVKQRIELDLLYISNWTAGMDAKILFRTFKMVIGFGKEDEIHTNQRVGLH